MPPREVVDVKGFSFGNADYAQLREYALKAFPSTYQLGTGEDVTSASKGDYILARRGAYGWEFGLYKGKALYEVYIGTLCFNAQNHWCVLAYNPQYGTFTKDYYNWDTGELEEIWVRTPDDSLVAVYSDKNVLKSYEIWSRTEGKWEFFDNEWAYSPDGVQECEPTEPTEDVLKKILSISGVAEYETVCATSVAAVEDTSVPFILAPKSAISNAAVSVESQRISETKTEYDISLNGDAQPTQAVTLSLPYPNGMTAEIAKDYAFAVVHEKNAKTTETMSTVAGSVEYTDHGLEVTADSFSPFTVDWGKANVIASNYPDAIQADVDTGSLPQTGDSSNLALLLGVLAASVCALVLVLRKRSVCR